MADHSSGTVRPVRLALVLLAIVLVSGLIGWWIPMSLPTLALAVVFGVWFYTSTRPWWRGP
jgi:uncharacterized membrane protein (UPF0136 family)